MSDKKTYQQEEQIRRYVQNEMTAAERNEFEREMQKDPFLTEAVDGFSAFSSNEVFVELETLRNNLQKNRRGSQRYIWYAAASVLLIIVSTFFLFNLEEKTNTVLSENMLKDGMDSSSQILQEPQQLQKNRTEQKQMLSAKESSIPIEQELEIADDETGVISLAENKTQNSLTYELSEQPKPQKSLNTNEKLKLSQIDNQQNTEPAKKSRQAASSKGNVAHSVSMKGMGKTIKAVNTDQETTQFQTDSKSLVMDNLNVAQSLDEIVVAVPLVEKECHTLGSVSKVPEQKNGKAIPSDGWEAYYKGYLDFELQHPDIGSPEKEVTVRLSFKVDETGKLSSFKILRSTDEKYNDYAVSLIKEGPGWWPAVKDSIPESETVKLKLVFPKVEK